MKPPGVPRFVYLLVLLEMTSLGMLFPVVPLRVAQLAGDGTPAVIGYGVSAFLFGLGFLLGAGLLGPLSDRHGRRPLMLLNCAGLAVGHLVAAGSPSSGLFVLCRGLCGFFSANITLGQAYVADLSTPDQRGTTLGRMGAMRGLGFIVGPILGGHLGQLDSRIPFLLAGSLSLVTGLAGLLQLPESLPKGRRSGSVRPSLNPFRSIGELRRLRGFGPLVPAFGILTLAQNVMTTSWVPYATARFDWGPRQNGWGLFFYGAIAAAAQGLLFPWLVRRIEVQRICRVAMISTGLTYIALGGIQDGVWFFGLMAANFVGFTVAIAFRTLASGQTDAAHQGNTMSGLQTLNNVTLVLAPIITAGLLQAMSLWPGSDWKAGLPLFFCAGLVFLALGSASPQLVLQPRRQAGPPPR